jgi:methylmalonyl-CoA mutase
MAEKLFTEFPPVTTEQWDAVIIKDLKGADYEKKLVWKTHEGFPVRPYYRAENLPDIKSLGEMPGQFPFVRGIKTDNNWLTRQDICLCQGIEKANAEALDILNKGVESLGFVLGEKKDLSEAEMEALLKGICIPAVEINFRKCCPKHSAETLKSFLAVVRKQGVKPEEVRASFDFSPLHRLTVKGSFCEDKAFGFLSNAVKAVADFPKIKVINVQAYDFNDAGSSLVQELAFGVAIGNEYIAKLTERGFTAEEVARRIKFTFGISSNYFMEIAKFRAGRVIWANIVRAWGVESDCACKMHVHAVTSQWNQTVYDAYVNMLRGTTETMSAAIAGVDSIEVLPFDQVFRAPGEFSNRIARNVQSILKEESHFNKIIDPAGGSYYIEELTQSIIDASWKLFKDVEEKGGYTEAFKAGFVQEQVKSVSDKKDKLLAQRRETLLGTNQFPNFLEKAGDEITKEIITRGAGCCDAKGCGCDEQMAEPLGAYRGAQPFEAMRLATDRNGRQPMAFMLTFGNLAMCRARAQFSCNFFAIAGFKVVDNNRFSTIEEGVEAALKAKADIVVACSADDEYLENVPKIAQLIGDKAIVVVAGDPECRPQLEEQGINHYIHVKCNVLDTLREYQKALGVKEL